MAKLASTNIFGDLSVSRDLNINAKAVIGDVTNATGDFITIAADGALSRRTAAEARADIGAPTLTGTGASGTWGISITGNADTVDSLHVNSTTRNNESNRICRTDANGYANFGWINTTSGNTTGTITDFYVNTNDGYIRKATKAHVLSQLGIDETGGVPTPTLISANHTTSASTHLLIDTSAAPITITMPAGVDGDMIRFTDFAGTWGTNNVTLSGGSYVNAAGTTQAGPFILDISNFDVVAIYHTGAWRIR